MNKETCMKEAEESILHTYNRFPVVFDHGEGVYLYDTDGKEYLDFAAGIAVQAFGYHNREYSEALKTQVDKLMHTSNLFYVSPASISTRSWISSMSIVLPMSIFSFEYSCSRKSF